MTRHAVAYDYTLPGIYHITLHVVDELGQPLGVVVGNPVAAEGAADAPRVVLTTVGRMVEKELLESIHQHYPMVEVRDYVIMPDHLHFLLMVKERIVSGNGHRQALGQVIAGFKVGCNRGYRQLMQREEPSAR